MTRAVILDSPYALTVGKAFQSAPSMYQRSHKLKKISFLKMRKLFTESNEISCYRFYIAQKIYEYL